MIRKNRIVLVIATLLSIAILAVVRDYNTAANIFLGVLAVKCWVFVLLYGIRSDWRATAPGRAIMRLVLCIGLICTQGTVTILTNATYPGRPMVRVILLAGVALAVLDLLVTLVSSQNDEREKTAGGGE
ncbi:hypothetical protein NDR87_31005 [Nocardia sp. CDC159]|uniref:Uncharacterized protein n=1 Tax=Nocardia pulmonis TaxID=2951408 RepID=A0A9X2EEK6_9NOCA|nr:MULTISPECIES: hypothetical protein [Nocardia]MCM6778020.1 hypothetical protein [Nocardia pulmonis]MCM6790809.1 hypothetical protein [Nocardia sp. CDC159]